MSLPAQIQYFQPQASLAPYVSVCFFTDMEVGEAGSEMNMFPVGYSVLSFAMDDLVQDFLHADKTLPRFNITGQLTRYYKLTIKPGKYRFLSVILKPYGAYHLLNFSQDTIADGFANINQVLGSQENLCEALQQNCDQPQEAMNLLQDWLLQRLQVNQQNSRLDAVIMACNEIDAGNGIRSIKQICEVTGMSKSSIERHFLEKIGLTPKMYSRIIRFNKVYQTLQTGDYEKWQDVVYQYNFYDQAHFIKDFKNFFNYTPSEVHKNRVNSAELLGSAG